MFSRKIKRKTISYVGFILTLPVIINLEAGEHAETAVGGAAGSISLLLVRVQCTSAQTEDRNFAATVEVPVREQDKAEHCGLLTQTDTT